MQKQPAVLLSRAVEAKDPSKDESDPHLTSARAVALIVDFAEVVRAKLIPRTSKSRCVCEVEKLGAELEVHSLLNHKALEDRCVHIVDAIRSQIGEVARRTSGVLISRIRKNRLFEEPNTGIAWVVND